jgi:hypothetical protein
MALSDIDFPLLRHPRNQGNVNEVTIYNLVFYPFLCLKVPLHHPSYFSRHFCVGKFNEAFIDLKTQAKQQLCNENHGVLCCAP